MAKDHPEIIELHPTQSYTVDAKRILTMHSVFRADLNGTIPTLILKNGADFCTSLAQSAPSSYPQGGIAFLPGDTISFNNGSITSTSFFCIEQDYVPPSQYVQQSVHLAYTVPVGMKAQFVGRLSGSQSSGGNFPTYFRNGTLWLTPGSGPTIVSWPRDGGPFLFAGDTLTALDSTGSPLAADSWVNFFILSPG